MKQRDACEEQLAILADKRSELEKIKAEEDEMKELPALAFIGIIKDDEKLTRDVIDALIDHIIVYEDDRYEIVWKARDEISQK